MNRSINISPKIKEMLEACGNTCDVVKNEKYAMAVMKNGVKYPKQKQARRMGSGHDHWEVEAKCHHDPGGPPKPLFTYGPGGAAHKRKYQWLEPPIFSKKHKLS